MSWRSLADVVRRPLPAGTFAAVVTGDEVRARQAAPRAVPRGGAGARASSCSECVAIEDSPPGVASAVAAGVPTIAVPHAVPVPHTVGAVQIDGLAGVKPADLLRLLR